MGKEQDSKNLDDLFGTTQGFGGFGTGNSDKFNIGSFGNGFCGNYNRGFGTHGFGERLDSYIMNPVDKTKEIIDNYEKEVKRADKDTRSDLINIDIELGKMSYPELAMSNRTPYPWLGAGYSRAKVKESVTNIVKRDRGAIAVLEATVAILSAALIITHIKKKK